MIYSTIVISLLFRDSSEPVEPLHGRPDVHEYDHVPPRVVEGGALEGAQQLRVEACMRQSVVKSFCRSESKLIVTVVPKFTQFIMSLLPRNFFIKMSQSYKNKNKVVPTTTYNVDCSMVLASPQRRNTAEIFFSFPPLSIITLQDALVKKDQILLILVLLSTKKTL